MTSKRGKIKPKITNIIFKKGIIKHKITNITSKKGKMNLK